MKTDFEGTNNLTSANVSFVSYLAALEQCFELVNYLFGPRTTTNDGHVVDRKRPSVFKDMICNDVRSV